MVAYVRFTPATGFRIVWTELKPGARSINHRNMPMTRAEWWQFCSMIREGLKEHRQGNVVYRIELEPAGPPSPGAQRGTAQTPGPPEAASDPGAELFS